MTDLACIDDLDPLGSEVSGLVAIEQSAVRRLTTAKGSILMAPDDGVDLREYLGDVIDPPTLAALRSEVLDELEKEDGILSATITQFVTSGEALTLSLDLVTVDGPLAFDLEIGAVTVRIIHREAST